MTTALETRPARTSDLGEIVDLLRLSMGRAADERFEALFRWKHLENAFGPSPMWVATETERIVAFRTFMRWQFRRGDQVVCCVRAVDTATHPDYQGRGLFTLLTRAALPGLASDGVQFVFNTPNAQSRPGYLKMGWQEVGRARVCVRPLSPRGASLLVRNRVPASHWSEPADFGCAAEDVLGEPYVDQLVVEERDGRLRTHLTPEFLRWRFASPVVPYRAIVSPLGPASGVALVRIRRRGRSREGVVGGLLLGRKDHRATRMLLREVLLAVRAHADYLVGVGALRGFVPIPRFGPIVTTRDVSAVAPVSLASFGLTLSDIELF